MYIIRILVQRISEELQIFCFKVINIEIFLKGKNCIVGEKLQIFLNFSDYYISSQGDTLNFTQLKNKHFNEFFLSFSLLVQSVW